MKKTFVGGYCVSTVELPMALDEYIFETLVFSEDHDEVSGERYLTEEEASAGHGKYVEKIEAGWVPCFEEEVTGKSLVFCYLQIKTAAFSAADMAAKGIGKRHLDQRFWDEDLDAWADEECRKAFSKPELSSCIAILPKGRNGECGHCQNQLLDFFGVIFCGEFVKAFTDIHDDILNAFTPSV